MVWMGKGNLVNPGELLNPYLEGIINSMRGRKSHLRFFIARNDECLDHSIHHQVCEYSA